MEKKSSLLKNDIIHIIVFTVLYSIILIFLFVDIFKVQTVGEHIIWIIVSIAISFSSSYFAVKFVSLMKQNEENKRKKTIDLHRVLLESQEERHSIISETEASEIVTRQQDTYSAETTNRKNALLKQKSQKDILALMLDNMAEIRDYFSISKSHAKLSFWLAIINCIVGIVLLCLSVHNALTNPAIEPSIIAGITGAIAEGFACTSLIVHKKSLEQFNHYYDALHENEMFLSTVHLVGNLSLEKQDEIYTQIINNEMNIRYKTFTGKNIEKDDEASKTTV